MATYEKTEIDYLLDDLIEPKFIEFSKHAVLPHFQTPHQFKAYSQWYWLFHIVLPDGFAPLSVQPSGVVGQGALL